MAAVDLFPEHAAGKVGHGKRMAVIETRHLELLDPKKSSGPMPVFDWWRNRGQAGSLTESRIPDCLSAFFEYLLILGAVLSLHYCMGFSLVAASGSYSPVMGHGLLVAVASLIGNRLWGVWASVVAMHGPSCPKAYGIFLDQGSNCVRWIGIWQSIHWQMDSGPLDHQGSPALFPFNKMLF